ncbi:Uncharacterised protein [Candidatus Tiddalikarchaeum anstoanum]|nr:Uncharacterised protein [Candidatus Tiddalikarchaeum anstoanum]
MKILIEYSDNFKKEFKYARPENKAEEECIESLIESNSCYKITSEKRPCKKVYNDKTLDAEISVLRFATTFSNFWIKNNIMSHFSAKEAKNSADYKIEYELE